MIVKSLPLFLVFFIACKSNCDQKTTALSSEDSLKILSMVKERETAMITRNLDSVMLQFDSTATFINGGGFYYQGLAEIKDFHNALFKNDSLTYTYKIGKVLIKPASEDVALVYYPWQQQWTMKNMQSDTLNEVGLMTITAVKQNNEWKWKAITNQRTKEYFEDLQEHKAGAIR